MELLFLLLLFSVLMIPMLLMSGRQRRMQREQQARVSEMTVGDEVRTHSGFYGLIVEEFGDIVILETEDGSQTKWARQALAMRVEDLPAAQGGTADLPAEDAEGTDTDADADAVPTDRSDDADRDQLAGDRRDDGDIPGVTGRR